VPTKLSESWQAYLLSFAGIYGLVMAVTLLPLAAVPLALGAALIARSARPAAGESDTSSGSQGSRFPLVLREQIATPIGRERLRERVDVEHSLTHIGHRQGWRARYRGVRKNNYDLRRSASIQNLETVQRAEAA
jgi:hypothetical protein